MYCTRLSIYNRSNKYHSMSGKYRVPTNDLEGGNLAHFDHAPAMNTTTMYSLIHTTQVTSQLDGGFIPREPYM